MDNTFVLNWRTYACPLLTILILMLCIQTNPKCTTVYRRGGLCIRERASPTLHDLYLFEICSMGYVCHGITRVVIY